MFPTLAEYLGSVPSTHTKQLPAHMRHTLTKTQTRTYNIEPYNNFFFKCKCVVKKEMEHLETCRLKVIKTCQIITVWFLRQGITCSQADYSSCSFFLFFIKPSNTRFSYSIDSLYLALFVCFIHSNVTGFSWRSSSRFSQIAISLRYCLSSGVYHISQNTPLACLLTYLSDGFSVLIRVQGGGDFALSVS